MTDAYVRPYEIHYWNSGKLQRITQNGKPIDEVNGYSINGGNFVFFSETINVFDMYWVTTDSHVIKITYDEYDAIKKNTPKLLEKAKTKDEFEQLLSFAKL